MATPVAAGVRRATAVPPGRRFSVEQLRRATETPPGRRFSVEQLRRATETPPGRLRLASALLAALVLLFGAVAAWEVSGQAQAADQVATHSEPLSRDAAEIYHSLADADTTAAGGFLLAGEEPAAVRQRYQDDLATAARLLSEAGASTSSSDGAQEWISKLNQQLPQYSGLVETARAYNRVGLPLGGAYLRYASKQMQTVLLPDAQKLVDAETKRVNGDYGDAGSIAYVALAVGVLTLAALGWYQLQLFRRTNRVFNIGLVGASTAVLVAMVWMVVGGTLAGSALDDSRHQGAEPLRTLNQARIQALQAHAAENLDLVARGSTDSYAAQWKTVTNQLAGAASAPGADGKAGPIGGTLAQARAQAPGAAAADLSNAEKAFTAWDAKHQAAAASNQAGDFDAALKATISSTDGETADTDFAAMDKQLAAAAAVEQAKFASATDGVSGSLLALAVGAAVLALLGAAGVIRGIGRRVAEYR